MERPVPKFVPGNMLQLKASPTLKFYVLECLVQQCYGGFQIHYDGRMVVKRGEYDSGIGLDPKAVRFTEPELELATQASESPIEIIKKLKEILIMDRKYESAALARDIERLIAGLSKED